MATLKDVAKLACVDVSTVSRALNNTSYVHPDTKARVYAAAKELGYHPNIMAQALRQGRRHTLGMIVPRLDLAIFAEILQGFEHEALALGYSTIISVTDDDPKIEKECLNRMRNGLVDGIVVNSTGRNNRLITDIKASGIPLVQMIRCQDPKISSVVGDYEACGYNAVKYLYGRGCRHIGLVAGALHLSPYAGRRKGYCEGVARYGLEEIFSESDKQVNTFQYGYECTMQLLDENPELDAIIAALDIQGLGVIRALKDRGLEMPGQIKVMSLTGHHLGGMLQTSMTSLEMPARQMGEKAAQMLISDIEAAAAGKPNSPVHISFPHTLVEREST